ncbi:hypothetical protein GCM10027160_28100 [Streptomyces calidiresistens]|uniref:Uncharacterized protein n=1 Tax=Streptomyces calidiresistens TaxID=1485586 RepID=A0A7W3XXW0_9ACTN|nr:hypothetical protein [Streptomyces calidiresistens]MBB0231369.1 hypothetical protein [Streptomyces calidiresistens]
MTIDRVFPPPRAGGLRLLRGGSPAGGERAGGTPRSPVSLRVVPDGTDRPDPDHDPEPDGRGPAGAALPCPVAARGVSVAALVTARVA